MNAPLVVSYGAGVDSTALLVGLRARAVRPDLILFADPGSEWPETYAYLLTMQAWLDRQGWPAIQVVRTQPPKRIRTASFVYTTLEEQCLATRTLPSLAYHRRSCSLKWKHEPMDAFVRAWAPAREALARGERVTRAIGYKKDRKRCWSITETPEWAYWYPLREWHWDRDRCEHEIAAAGLPVPRKSACFFCPGMQTWELDELQDRHPELAERIVQMETNAAPKLTTIEGLWSSTTRKRPGRMTDYLRRRLPLAKEPT